jgi:hypothetical protein
VVGMNMISPFFIAQLALKKGLKIAWALRSLEEWQIKINKRDFQVPQFPLLIMCYMLDSNPNHFVVVLPTELKA